MTHSRFPSLIHDTAVLNPLSSEFQPEKIILHPLDVVSAVSQVTATTFLEGTDSVGKSPETHTALHTQQLQEQPGTNKDQGVSSSLSVSLSSVRWKVKYPSYAEPWKNFQ